MVLQTTKRKKLLTTIAVALFIGVGIGLLVLPLLSTAPSNVHLQGTDTVESWRFTGAYGEDTALMNQTNKEIAKLKAEAGKPGYPLYETYVGIAGQYELLGDGKRAYEYLQKAIAEDESKGLAYVNLGHLMERLGAYKTAKDAYDQAVAAEPGNAAFKAVRATFIKAHFPNE